MSCSGNVSRMTPNFLSSRQIRPWKTTPMPCREQLGQAAIAVLRQFRMLLGVILMLWLVCGGVFFRKRHVLTYHNLSIDSKLKSHCGAKQRMHPVQTKSRRPKLTEGEDLCKMCSNDCLSGEALICQSSLLHTCVVVLWKKICHKSSTFESERPNSF